MSSVTTSFQHSTRSPRPCNKRKVIKDWKGRKKMTIIQSLHNYTVNYWTTQRLRVLTPHAVKNLHLTFDSHKTLLIIYGYLRVGLRLGFKGWGLVLVSFFKARVSRRKGQRVKENPKQTPHSVQSTTPCSVSQPWNHELSQKSRVTRLAEWPTRHPIAYCWVETLLIK